jgi:hypothetical protein
MVCALAVAPATRMFSLGKRGHDVLPLILQNCACRMGRRIDYSSPEIAVKTRKTRAFPVATDVHLYA